MDAAPAAEGRPVPNLQRARIAIVNDIREQKRDQLLAEIGPDVVTTEMLAERVGICTRTVYRYVQQLRAAGHKILSGPGFGYLRPERRN
ncbi:helix-turn-helix domain-containing protein [Mesorhizobium sp. M2A.F.Ca.ET.067.02.1.1]|nr:helix-turn-helix domain-containing protein [Mesorhizobium sp. M2A.F.Ca.ET.067.02.1.1]TIU53410.1 MAG: HTH domain-containing protein [Mesorhizobium sp.]